MPVNQFILLMQGAWNLARNYGGQIRTDEFAQYMRQVLTQGTDGSLPERVRNYGAAYIRELLAARHLIALPALPVSPVNSAPANGDAQQFPDDEGPGNRPLSPAGQRGLDLTD